jgi:hypothetical protein
MRPAAQIEAEAQATALQVGVLVINAAVVLRKPVADLLAMLDRLDALGKELELARLHEQIEAAKTPAPAPEETPAP